MFEDGSSIDVDAIPYYFDGIGWGDASGSGFVKENGTGEIIPFLFCDVPHKDGHGDGIVWGYKSDNYSK